MIKSDIILISLSNPQTDSRTLNLFNSLKESGLDVHLIAVAGSSLGNISVIDPGTGRLARRWWNFTRKIKKLNIDSTVKIIIACDLYSLPAAAILKRRLHTKLFYDSREFYFALGPIAGKNFKQSAITRIERFYEKFVDEMIVSSALDEQIIRKHFAHNKPYNIIMNLPPFKNYINSDKIRNKFRIPKGKTIIVYQGMVLPGRGIEPLIESIAGDERFALAILGDGEYLDNVKNKVKSKNLEEQVFFTGKIPYDELHLWTCSGDIGAALFEPVSLSYEYALPNKIFEYMMAHLPSIATDLPALSDLHTKAGCFELVDRRLKPVDILRAIEKLLDGKVYMEYRELCKKNALVYNYDNQKENFVEYLKNLL